MSTFSKWRHKISKWLGLEDEALANMKLGDFVPVIMAVKDWLTDAEDELKISVGDLKETIRGALRVIGRIM